MQFWLDYDEDVMRRVYRERKAAELSKPKLKREDLYKAGYTDEEIDNDSTLFGAANEE
jgi:hypothetical protein